MTNYVYKDKPEYAVFFLKGVKDQDFDPLNLLWNEYFHPEQYRLDVKQLITIEMLPYNPLNNSAEISYESQLQSSHLDYVRQGSSKITELQQTFQIAGKKEITAAAVRVYKNTAGDGILQIGIKNEYGAILCSNSFDISGLMVGSTTTVKVTFPTSCVMAEGETKILFIEKGTITDESIKLYYKSDNPYPKGMMGIVANGVVLNYPSNDLYYSITTFNTCK
jgi:hypothetical protein